MPLGSELQPIMVLAQRLVMARVPVIERRIASYEGILTPGILTAEAKSTCESGPVRLALRRHDRISHQTAVSRVRRPRARLSVQ
jgi:hypothetical protein